MKLSPFNALTLAPLSSERTGQFIFIFFAGSLWGNSSVKRHGCGSTGKVDARGKGLAVPYAVVRYDSVSLVPADELRQYETALQNYFRRRVAADQVDDLVQEALTRLFASHHAEQLQTPLAYLFRIASNLLADNARRQRTSPPASDEEKQWAESHLSVLPDQENQLFLRDLEKDYALALAALPARARAVFIMRRHDGLSTPEIAARLRITKRMVQKHMVTALDLLSQRLQSYLKDV